MELKLEDNSYVHNLLFADDQVVIIRAVEDANYTGREMEEYEKWGLKNYGKTEYLGNDHSEKLQIDGNTNTTVKECKYLGSILQDNGSSDLGIEKKISETRRVITMTNSILWNRNTLQSTTLIYKSTVRSILTYGAETWSIK
jgi:hypothetical protein